MPGDADAVDLPGNIAVAGLGQLAASQQGHRVQRLEGVAEQAVRHEVVAVGHERGQQVPQDKGERGLPGFAGTQAGGRVVAQARGDPGLVEEEVDLRLL